MKNLGAAMVVTVMGLVGCSVETGEPDPDFAEETAQTQEALVTCHDYENGYGDSCSICFWWHWTGNLYGSWKELDHYSDFCD